MRERSSQRLALLAALPQECSAILDWSGWKRLEASQGLSIYGLQREARSLRLAVGGMGGDKARAALGSLVKDYAPTRLISIGFAGALDPGLRVGDVVVGTRVFMWRARGQLVPGRGLECPWEGSGFKNASVVSAPGLVSKLEVLRDLDRQWLPAVLDLETFTLAQEAEEKGIPFSSIRAVSDEWDMDVGPRIEGMLGEDLVIKPSRMMLRLISRPWESVLLWRLLRRSRVAARGLGNALFHVLVGSS